MSSEDDQKSKTLTLVISLARCSDAHSTAGSGPDPIFSWHARYYDAAGRFLSIDPVLGDPAVPQSWNLYTYVLNSPIDATDPSGLLPCEITLPTGEKVPGECVEVTAKDPGPPMTRWLDSTLYGWAQARETESWRYIHSARADGGPKVYGEPVMFGSTAGIRGALLGTPRSNLLTSVTNPRLRRIIERLYRANAEIGSGSTADAIRYEAETGQLLSPSGHVMKGIEMRTALVRVLRGQALSPAEKTIVRTLLIDLQNALSGL